MGPYGFGGCCPIPCCGGGYGSGYGNGIGLIWIIVIIFILFALFNNRRDLI
jgi:hypothetical protein